MTGLTRDRSCTHYIPWIAVTSLAILAVGVGLWLGYGLDTYNDTVNGLKALNVQAQNMDRGEPAVIASAVVSLVIVCAILALAIWRVAIERHHDVTGHCGSGSRMYLVLNTAVAICWWILVIWLVLLIQGTSLWSILLYVSRRAIDNTLVAQSSLPAPPVWNPSLGLPCPPQCLDLTQFTYISTDFADSCVCDPNQLTAARNFFQEGLNAAWPTLAGVWLMWLGAAFLLVNLACAFSHTLRERDYIHRAAAAGKPYGNNQQFTSA